VAVESVSFPQRLFVSMAGFAAAFGTLALLAVSPALPIAHGQDFIELTPELDARAASLYAGIMCPICDGQTISQSHAQISETMRQMVRERLIAGDSDDEIYAFMTSAFGEDILASPPTSGIGVAVWVVPPIALLLGAVTVAFVVRQLRASPPRKASANANAALSGESSDALDPYLGLVDREMGDAAGEQR